MAPIPHGGAVAVTGSAGFIGGWVVRQLLERGYKVRACVRDPGDDAKVGFLKAMPGYASGRLSLHAADLDNAGSFDAAFAGAQGVCHVSHVTAAPAPDREGHAAWNSQLRKYSDQDYIADVCAHLIDSINRSGSVQRVIVTSSIAAVIAEADLQEFLRRPVLYEDRYPDDANPKRTAERQGYSMGKVPGPAPVHRRRRSQRRSLGRDHLLPRRQRRAHPVAAPEGRRSLAAPDRGDAEGSLRAERRLPPLDDRRRPRRRRLPRGPSGKRQGPERRALHRLVRRRFGTSRTFASASTAYYRSCVTTRRRSPIRFRTGSKRAKPNCAASGPGASCATIGFAPSRR